MFEVKVLVQASELAMGYNTNKSRVQQVDKLWKLLFPHADKKPMPIRGRAADLSLLFVDL